MMTKVARLFEQEKQDAIKEALIKQQKELAWKLLDVLSPDKIAEVTGLDIEEVQKMRSYIVMDDSTQKIIKKIDKAIEILDNRR